MDDVKNDESTIELIRDELNQDIQNEFNIRNILDTKILTSAGVMAGFLAFLVPQLHLPTIAGNQDFTHYLVIVVTITGLTLVGVSLVCMLSVEIPKKYAYLDFENLISLNDKSIRYCDLLRVLNIKKTQILNEYRFINAKKSKALHTGIVFYIIGISLIIISVLLS